MVEEMLEHSIATQADKEEEEETTRSKTKRMPVGKMPAAGRRAASAPGPGSCFFSDRAGSGQLRGLSIFVCERLRRDVHQRKKKKKNASFFELERAF